MHSRISELNNKSSDDNQPSGLLEPDKLLNQLQKDLFPPVPGIPQQLHRRIALGQVSPALLDIFQYKLHKMPRVQSDPDAARSPFELSIYLDLAPLIYQLLQSDICQIGGQKDSSKKAFIKPFFDTNESRRLPSLVDIATSSSSVNDDEPQDNNRSVELFKSALEQVCWSQNTELKFNSLVAEIEPLDMANDYAKGSLLVAVLAIIALRARVRADEETIKKYADQKGSIVNIVPLLNLFTRALLANILLGGQVLSNDHFTIGPNPRKVNLCLTHWFNAYQMSLDGANLLSQILNLAPTYGTEEYACQLQGSFLHTVTEHLTMLPPQLEPTELLQELLFKEKEKAIAFGKLCDLLINKI